MSAQQSTTTWFIIGAAGLTVLAAINGHNVAALISSGLIVAATAIALFAQRRKQ